MDAFDIDGHIARMWTYPIKSCAGIALTEARLLPTGLEHDRRFMLVDGQGEFLTQRSLPRMALVQPQLPADGTMQVSAPGMPTLAVELDFDGPERTVQVWDDRVQSLAAPAAVNQWFSDFLGQDCALVRFAPGERRLASAKWTRGVEAPTQFADGYPLLVITQAAVEELNERLVRAGHAPVGPERFRPNLLIGGWQAHDEDRVDECAIRLDAAGDAWLRLALVKPCARCPIPDIDPRTAESHPSVSDTLRGYRQDARLDGAITFGMNAIALQADGPVELAVGQAVGGMLQFD
ncbi:MAG: MOSC domain-containing protein [Comamonas sp.]